MELLNKAFFNFKKFRTAKEKKVSTQINEVNKCTLLVVQNFPFCCFQEDIISKSSIVTCNTVLLNTKTVFLARHFAMKDKTKIWIIWTFLKW